MTFYLNAFNFPFLSFFPFLGGAFFVAKLRILIHFHAHNRIFPNTGGVYRTVSSLLPEPARGRGSEVSSRACPLLEGAGADQPEKQERPAGWGERLGAPRATSQGLTSNWPTSSLSGPRWVRVHVFQERHDRVQFTVAERNKGSARKRGCELLRQHLI